MAREELDEPTSEMTDLDGNQSGDHVSNEQIPEDQAGDEEDEEAPLIVEESEATTKASDASNVSKRGRLCKVAPSHGRNNPGRKKVKIPERLKRNKTKARITTSPPKVKLNTAETPREDYGRLRLLSERARVEASRRAVELEQKNPNKVMPNSAVPLFHHFLAFSCIFLRLFGCLRVFASFLIFVR